jgi:thioredoxin reductase (NADPH)
MVTDVTADEAGFVITTNKGTTHSKAVIVASGKGKFEPRKLPLEGVEHLEGKHIHYFLGDLAKFANKRVLVAGGGDSAVDTALMLNETAAEVRIMHRRDQFRALEHSIQQLDESNIVKDTPYMIQGIDELEDGSLNVSLKKMKTDEIDVVNVDEIVVSYGFISENKIIQGWNIQPELSEKQNMLVNMEMMTSIPGVYAVGDANDYQGKTDLIATGFGEAPTAVNAAIRQIYPERGGAIHSSSLKIEDGEVKH